MPTTNLSLKRPVPLALTGLDLSSTSRLVFAGGGNRCMWQAGLVTQLLHAGWRLPVQMVGTSAGAGVATALIADKMAEGMEVCKQLYANNPRIVDWSKAWRGRLGFAHEHIFPAWVESYLNESTFEAVRNARSRLRVAFARPHPLLGLHLSTLAGTLAYVVDKHINHSIHPRLPQLLGLKLGYVDLHDCTSLAAAQNLLSAAAAAPPFMRARFVAGVPALDGGFVDNAPIGPLQSDKEVGDGNGDGDGAQSKESAEAVAHTLVLLTRFYPKLPSLFSWQGRSYWQPSRKVPVSTRDCTPKTTIQDAYGLGTQDAQHFLSSPFFNRKFA